jgi:hypothetical protein
MQHLLRMPSSISLRCIWYLRRVIEHAEVEDTLMCRRVKRSAVNTYCSGVIEASWLGVGVIMLKPPTGVAPPPGTLLEELRFGETDG